MTFDSRRDLRAFLRINPWFAALPEPMQASLVESGRRTSLAKGQWLFGEGDTVGGLWMVLSGALRVEVSAGSDRFALFEIAGPGAILPRSAGFVGRPRPVTMRGGAARTLLLVVPDAGVTAACEAHPGLEMAIEALFSEQVNHILRIAAGALCLTPRAKVAGRLLLFSEGRLDRPEFVKITQSDLAEMTGLSRKSVHGHLQAFQKMRAIRLGYGGIKILDPARLVAIAEG
jgi:CRP/FNR family cyclic AMP-dependent transcriptional regulator